MAFQHRRDKGRIRGTSSAQSGKRRDTGLQHADVGERLRSEWLWEAIPALDEAYRRHAAAVLTFAVHRLGDRESAKQVLEEVFISLWDHPDGAGAGGRSLRQRLVREAHRRCSERQSPVVGRTAAGHAVPEVGPGVALDTDERLALDLAYLGEMTCAEIAALLGWPEVTVKARLRRALDVLCPGPAPSAPGPFKS